MQAKTKGIVAGILGAFFWGISNVLVAFMTSSYAIAPTWLGCMRVLTAGAVFTAVCAATDKENLLALLRTAARSRARSSTRSSASPRSR